jgi:hypothetical protein
MDEYPEYRRRRDSRGRFIWFEKGLGIALSFPRFLNL